MSDTTRTVDLSGKPDITPFFDTLTNTVSYVVKDPGSNACAVIDSVMDIDYAAGRIAYKSADNIIAYEPRPQAGMVDRDACSRRSSFRRALHPGQARRQDRHR